MPYQVIVEKGENSNKRGELIYKCCLNGQTKNGPRGGKGCTKCKQCTAYLATENRRCSRKTCMDSKLCYTHLQHKYRESLNSEPVIIGLKLKPTAYGTGLFTTRTIEANTYIMELDYETLTKEQVDKRYDYKEGNRTISATAPYSLALFDDKVADALCVRNAPSYANDPKGSRRQRNAVHILDPASQKLWLKSTRKIKKGSEVLVRYGQSYWRGHEWLQHEMKVIKGR